MKLINVIVQLLILALLAFVGALLLTAPFSGARWDLLKVGLTGLGRVKAVSAGLFLLCLVALFVLTAVRTRRPRYLTFDAEGGKVRMSTEAIADYVAKLAAEFPSVVRMRPEIVPLRRALDINVDVRVKAGPQIHEVCELLQRRVRESVTNGLGIGEIRRVVVSVSEVVSEHKPQ
ncbi:MAG: alkaline shock response membrane anchor protein AmaP [Lentisphaerae bacterium]|nr:alkaline shock response membrane anchor protein AmaP [Lentisphaerota bacterium]